MALITCPKCAHQVKPSEQECPKCGVIFKKYQEGVLKAQKVLSEKAKQEHQTRSTRLTTCGACTNTISRLAPACPRCGEPQKPDPTLQPDEKHLTGLFDLNFTSLITPQLIKLLYIVVIVIGFIGCFGSVVSSLYNPFEPVQIIISIAAYLLLVLFTRIGCESILLLFKIEKNTRQRR